jgi:hypothetical protein
MKYKILKYVNTDEKYDCYLCEDENGERKYLDIFVDSSYQGFGNLRGNKDKVDKKRISFVGKYIEVGSLIPYTPLYFARNVKLLKELE